MGPHLSPMDQQTETACASDTASGTNPKTFVFTLGESFSLIMTLGRCELEIPADAEGSSVHRQVEVQRQNWILDTAPLGLVFYFH